MEQLTANIFKAAPWKISHFEIPLLRYIPILEGLWVFRHSSGCTSREGSFLPRMREPSIEPFNEILIKG
jgi:hypothetical protein